MSSWWGGCKVLSSCVCCLPSPVCTALPQRKWILQAEPLEVLLGIPVQHGKTWAFALDREILACVLCAHRGCFGGGGTDERCHKQVLECVLQVWLKTDSVMEQDLLFQNMICSFQIALCTLRLQWPSVTITILLYYCQHFSSEQLWLWQQAQLVHGFLDNHEFCVSSRLFLFISTVEDYFVLVIWNKSPFLNSYVRGLLKILTCIIAYVSCGYNTKCGVGELMSN